MYIIGIGENRVNNLNTKDFDISVEIIEEWQDIVDIMAEVTDVPTALITRVEPPYIEIFSSSEGDENPYERGDKDELAGLYCEEVIRSRDKLLVPNSQKEDRWRDNPDVEKGMISYLGYPLEWPDGDIFGTICVLDNEENHYDKKTERLMERFKELVEIHLALINKNKELEEHIHKRKEAEKRKDLLHSLLRHDVKNKAQIIQGYLELLEQNVALPDGVREYLEGAKRGNQESIELIEKVSLLRKAEEEENEVVDMVSAVSDAVKIYNDLAEEKDIEIDVQIHSDKIEVEAGPLLKEVFTNIIENSIYHSMCSKIMISTETIDGEVRCIIEDDGVGIPEEDKEHVFEKGYTDEKDGGAGLGLFLVKILIESYGGNIELKDSELGGVRFDIYLKRP